MRLYYPPGPAIVRVRASIWFQWVPLVLDTHKCGPGGGGGGGGGGTKLDVCAWVSGRRQATERCLLIPGLDF